jgi:hypothetical protein
VSVQKELIYGYQEDGNASNEGSPCAEQMVPVDQTFGEEQEVYL